jgi:hemoglobin
MSARRLLALLALLVWSGSAAHADDSLYQDLGERAGIAKFVDAAFVHILADPRIKAQFDDVNIDRLKGRLTDQICVVTGGPCVYKGRDMKTAHKATQTSEADFNALVEDLQKGMDETGIGFRTQNRLLAILAPMERDVVTR